MCLEFTNSVVKNIIKIGVEEEIRGTKRICILPA